MQVYQSSDQSKVLVSKDDAYQVFRHEAIYDRVLDVALEVLSSADAPVNTILRGGEVYSYTLSDFHTRMIGSDKATLTIRWERMTCLNQLPKKEMLENVRKNFHKFLWDILKGIFGLGIYGFCHGDVCLDNIAMRGRNYALFDYNLSRRYSAENFARDLNAFVRSIRFNFRNLNYTLTVEEETLLDRIRNLWNLEEYLVYIKQQYQLSSTHEAARRLDEMGSSTSSPPPYEENDTDEHRNHCYHCDYGSIAENTIRKALDS